MAGLIDYLRSFNRKERFALVGLALGNPRFRLAAPFRGRIRDELGPDVPEDAFVAMDYHLDWLYASLHLHRHGGDPGPHTNADRLIRAQQEDVDLLVAFEDRGVGRIVLLEAKGATGWTNKQMSSKAKRLREIFGERGTNWPEVFPHFAIVSPRRPQRLVTAAWPAWMLPAGVIPWIKIEMGEGLSRPTRCTAEGLVSAAGEYWKVVPA
jgi:hypothetical protein